MSTTEGTLQLPLKCPLVINGEEGTASTGRRFDRENPADNRQTVTTAEEGDAGDMRSAIDAARTAFDSNSGSWVNNYKLREKVLYQTGELIRANAKELAAIVRLEVGMPERQAVVHVTAAADIFEFYAGYASKLYGETTFLPSGSMINLVKEPVGVVGLITPWNFPLTQTARKVAPALAVGCTLVLKPASYTPYSTYQLVKLLHQASVPKGVVNFVTGPGRVVGNEMVRSPKVDKVSFTGVRPAPARASLRRPRWRSSVSAWSWEARLPTWCSRTPTWMQRPVPPYSVCSVMPARHAGLPPVFYYPKASTTACWSGL